MLFEAARLRPLLVAGLVTVWGVRLAAHIFRRHRGGGEDPRSRAGPAPVGPKLPGRYLAAAALA
jgi:steroid 5-alpha reductase family enzyme